MCRGGVRKIKAKLELNLSRYRTNNRKGSTGTLVRKGRSKKVQFPNKKHW